MPNGLFAMHLQPDLCFWKAQWRLPVQVLHEPVHLDHGKR